MLMMILAATAVQPAVAADTGLTVAAAATTQGVPRTFDLAGFRLGMSEQEVENVIRSRGLKVRNATRVTDFEQQVRSIVNMRGGHVQMTRGSVLGEADLDDGKGGRVLLRMFTWPDGARVRSVSYQVPAGTDAAEWKRLLTDKYGAAGNGGRRIGSGKLTAQWCGRTSSCLDAFRLSADVGATGGSIDLEQPDGSGQRLQSLVEAEASKRTKAGRPAL